MATKIKGYSYTGKYSWTKAKAQERATKARKAGYSVRVIKAKTRKIGKTGYVLFAKTTKKGYAWKRRKKI